MLKLIERNDEIINLNYFTLLDLNYNFSFRFNLVKLQYNIGFYDINQNLILPSDLSLFNKLHIVCYFINLNNKYFNCIDIVNINVNAKFGIKIYQEKENIEFTTFYLFNETVISYKNLFYNNDNLFCSFLINQKYNYLNNKFNEKNTNDSLKFQKSFSLYPHSILKYNSILDENKWYYRNIYNHYFCFCKGNNISEKNYKKQCKYYFYLNVINNNRHICKKTDYLFVDFIFSELSSDDTFPIFEKMNNLKLPVHYITEHIDIYNKFCYINRKCFKIIYVGKKNYTMDGNFLENYLNLLLKLKVVVSARAQGFNYLTNIFYNLEYVTYIGVGHGVSFFKYFLYADYETYGINQNDQILIPNTEKLISVALKYGWKRKNIIKMNLPKWDKFNFNYKDIFILNNNESIKNNSILIMFTWREPKRRQNISPYYFKNILSLLGNIELYNSLVENNIIIYVAFHHLVGTYINIDKYKEKLKKKLNIHLIDNNNIFNFLFKTNLLVTDFSSIIFDFIYQRKPFIIYIPDGKDENLEKIYTKNYFEVIQSLVNGTIDFENKYFFINKTVEKMIYYINNKFKLEKSLEKFYDSFNLKKENCTDEFIKYIINL